ncbi:hypothetical protein RugamoR57_32780 [Duganella caerulea]
MTFGAVVLLLTAAIVAIGVYWRSTQRSSSYGMEEQYALSDKAVADLKPLALAGDCAAARRLSLHYLNVALNFDEGLRWARVAARCPDVLDKMRLVVLLRQLQRSPAVDLEIERTVEEIGRIDPGEGERVRSTVNEKP